MEAVLDDNITTTVERKSRKRLAVEGKNHTTSMTTAPPWLVVAAVATLASAADTSAADSREGKITEGHKALRKGLHHKAYEHFRSAWRHSPDEAFEHAELQEGLCVCAARLKKE